MAAEQLTIIADARYVIPMGYGNIWKATVRQVVAGTLIDDQIQLSLFNNSDGRLYNGHFRSGGEATGVRLTFRRIAERPGALVGFVAKDGAIWELSEVSP